MLIFSETSLENLLIYMSIISTYLLYLFSTWLRYGKNAMPPEAKGDQLYFSSRSPVFWNYLLEKGDIGKSLQGFFLNLAARGAIRVISKSDFQIVKQNYDGIHLAEYEHEFLTQFFVNQNQVPIRSKYNEKFKVLTDKVMDVVSSQVDVQDYYANNLLFKILLVPISLCFIILASFFLGDKNATPLLIMLSIFIYLPFLISYLFHSTYPMGAPIVLVAISLLLLMVAEANGLLDAVMPVVVLGTSSWVYLKNMTKVTKKGKAFEQYIYEKKKALVSEPQPTLISPQQFSREMMAAYLLNVDTEWIQLNRSHRLLEISDIGIQNPTHFKSRFLSKIRNMREKPDRALDR